MRLSQTVRLLIDEIRDGAELRHKFVPTRLEPGHESGIPEHPVIPVVTYDTVRIVILDIESFRVSQPSAVSESQVEIPQMVHFQPASFPLGYERALAEVAVGILCKLLNDVVVYERVHIDVGRISLLGIRHVGTVQ